MTADRYLSFLFRLLLCQTVSDRGLRLLCPTAYDCLRFARCGLESGHLRKVLYTKPDAKSCTMALYLVTAEGLRYLFQNEKQVLFPFVDNDYAWNFSPIGKSAIAMLPKLRTAMNTTALLLAHRAGASVPFENFTADSSEISSDPYSILDFVRECLCEEAYRELDPFPVKDSGIVFHNTRMIKTSAAQSSDYASMRDYQAGRYSGVVDSPCRSLGLYTAPLKGMSWSPWILEKEDAALSLWKKSLAGSAPAVCAPRSSCAALVVTRPYQFHSLYFDAAHVRRSDSDVFGGMFDHFYILPSNRCGVSVLKCLMTQSDAEIASSAARVLAETGEYRIGDDPRTSLFPLRDREGHPAAMCFTLDAKQILQIEQRADRFPRETFLALCLPWQYLYCASVLPDNVLPVSVSVPFLLPSRRSSEEGAGSGAGLSSLNAQEG